MAPCSSFVTPLHLSVVFPNYSTVFLHLLNTPNIEYSNILNTEVVHGPGSLPKIMKFKGCIQFDLLNTKISGPFFQLCMERFLTRVE